MIEGKIRLKKAFEASNVPPSNSKITFLCGNWHFQFVYLLNLEGKNAEQYLYFI